MKFTKHFVSGFVLAIATALLLSACGGSSQGATSPSTTPVPTRIISPTATFMPTPTPIPQPAHTGQTAEQIVQALKVHSMPIGVYFVYTAANDVNNLLGRPGQYIGKANFKDTRISSTDQGASTSVSDGGSVEVFATVAQAQHRFAYIQGLSTSGNALFAEYEYLDGVAILRISAQLTPDQAKAYQAAFKALH